MFIIVISLSHTEKCHRSPGDRWMIFGPTEYIPPIEVTVKSTRFDAFVLSSLINKRLVRKLVFNSYPAEIDQLMTINKTTTVNFSLKNKDAFRSF